MTLTKAIEAAREALKGSVEWVGWQTFDAERHKDMMKVRGNVDKALAALPDKPMTEEEINALFWRGVKKALPKYGGVEMTFDEVVKEGIRALKAANVLYVEKANGKEAPEG